MNTEHPPHSGAGVGKVLVIGGDTRAFLATVRSLGRRGGEVHVLPVGAEPAALASRYVRQVHQPPAVADDEQVWVDWLANLLRRESYELVVPCVDSVIATLQVHREQFADQPGVYLLDHATFEIVSDKVASRQQAAALGLPVPVECAIHSVSDGPSVAARLGFPVVIKPRTSHGSMLSSGRRMVRRADSLAVLDDEIQAMLADGECVAQSFCPGVGVGVELLMDRGACLVAFQHRRVHEPLRGGGSSYRVSEALHPELLDAAVRLLSSLRFHGPAMVEFRVDRRTGQWVFMEVNARVWGSLPVALASGVDFPYYWHQLHVHGRREFPTAYTTGVYCRHITNDLAWLWRNLRADRSDPTLATLPLAAVVGEVAHVLTAREHFDTFVVDDPLPAAVELKRLADRLLGSLGTRIRVLTAALPWCRHALRRRALAALAKARSVLFVCKGNICRSPFAQLHARRVWPEQLHLDSAGYYPVTNRRSPDEALAAADRLGLDMSAHRSRPLTPAMLREYDVIVVFDQDNYDQVVQLDKSARGKTHFVGALLLSGPLAVIDPYGCGEGAFDEAYGRIMAALDEARKGWS